MGEYARRYTILFTKQLYRCPKCGEKRYRRCEVDGIEIALPEYGLCHNCYGFKFNCKKGENHQGSFTYPSDKVVAEYLGQTPVQTNTILPSQKKVYSISLKEMNYYNNGCESVDPLCEYFNSIGLDYHKTFEKYRVAPMQDFKGCLRTSFWLTDYEGVIRNAKQIAFLKNGHRNKDVDMSWVSRSIAYNEARKQHYDTNTGHEIKDFIAEFDKSYSFTNPLFGEHLLANNNLPVLLFESEKTAVIMDAYCRMNDKEAVCIAVGGKYNFNNDKLKVLNGRQVFLFPDSDTFKVGENGKSEIDNILANITDVGLRKRIKVQHWFNISNNSILSARKEELEALCGSLDQQSFIDAKLDIADIICYRLEHSKKKQEDIPQQTSKPDIRSGLQEIPDVFKFDSNIPSGYSQSHNYND